VQGEDQAKRITKIAGFTVFSLSPAFFVAIF